MARLLFSEIPGATVTVHTQEVHTASPCGHQAYAATVSLPDGRVWDVRDARATTATEIDYGYFEDGAAKAACVDLVDAPGMPRLSGVDVRVSARGAWADLTPVPADELAAAFSLGHRDHAQEIG